MIVPKEPTAHPSDLSKKTASHRNLPVSASWRVHVAPPSVVRAIIPSVRYLTSCTPLPAPFAFPRQPEIQPLRSSRKKTLVRPDLHPVDALSSSHDSPPLTVRKTAPDLNATHPRVSSRKNASERGSVFSKNCLLHVSPPPLS